jgi:nucleoside-diphosphate-sugar epimerase
MNRIVVTGATGFIGSHVLAHLRRRNFLIHALGRHPPKDRDVVFHPTDLLDPRQVDNSLRTAGATHLLHLAWYAEPGLYWRSPKNLDWVAASLHLAQSFAANGGQRAVFAGTCAEYEWGSGRFNEFAAPCAPATLYGVSKDALRRLVAAYGAAAPL